MRLLGLGAAAGLPSLIRVPRAFAGAFEVPSRYTIVPPGDERDPAELWEGDEVRAMHPVIRDEGRPDAPPVPSEDWDVVVIGGGISGLTAAFLLREKKTLLLEAQSRAGGNSRSGTWQGIEYAQGAAYMLEPTEGDVETGAIWRALELAKHGRQVDESVNGVFFQRRLFKHIWDPTSKEQVTQGFRDTQGYFRHVYDEKFPDVPFDPGGAYTRAEFAAIDRASFPELVQRGKARWGKAKLAKLDPVLEEALELYSRSSCGAPLNETSAWLFLNFFTSELGKVRAFPGGNARVAQLLEARLPPQSVRKGAAVVDVRNVKDRVLVTYADGAGGFRTVRGKAAIVAAPKFIASRIVARLPRAQYEAMRSLRYNAYLVANVMVNKAILPDLYDTYCLTGRVADLRQDDLAVPFTDLLVANWAASEKHDRTIITLYHALPFEGSRFLLLQDESFFTLQEEIRRGVLALLEQHGLSDKDIAEVRLARWGHPLVRPDKGLFSSGRLELASRPFGRIRFAQQDTYGAAAIENAIISATRAAASVSALL